MVTPQLMRKAVRRQQPRPSPSDGPVAVPTRIAAATVILLTTIISQGLDAQTFRRRIYVGAHGGTEVLKRDLYEWRLGGQVSINVWRGIDIAGGYNVYLSDQLTMRRRSREGAGRQGWVSARVSPLGSGWFVGAGATVIVQGFKPDLRTEWRVLIETGLEPDIGRFRPFVNLQFHDPFSPGYHAGLTGRTLGGPSTKLAGFYVVLAGVSVRLAG